MQKKFLFLSLYDKHTHIQFEASMIRVYLNAYKQKEATIFGNREHVKMISEMLYPEYKIHTIWSQYSLSIFLSLSYFLKTFLFSNYYRVDLSGFFASPFYFISWFNQDQIIAHVPWWHDRRVLRLFFGFLNFQVTTLILFRKKKIVVLGKWVFDSYMECKFLLNRQKSMFFWVTHPFFWKTIESVYLSPSRKPIFSLLGNNNARHKLFTNASLIYELALQNGVKIQNYWHLEYEIYINILLNSDYIIIPYLQNYKYMCSGILIETLSFKKPVICFKSRIADFFFNQYGPLWFCVTNLDELINVIINLSNWTLTPPNFNENLAKVSSFLTSPDNIAQEYLENYDATFLQSEK